MVVTVTVYSVCMKLYSLVRCFNFHNYWLQSLTVPSFDDQTVIREFCVTWYFEGLKVVR